MSPAGRGDSATVPDPADVSVFRAANDAWTEESVTWRTALNVQTPAVDSTRAVSDADHQYAWDLTAAVEAELHGDSLLSVQLRVPLGQTGLMDFDARETAFPPVLDLQMIAGDVSAGSDIHHPFCYALEQNFPNPFNPTTSIAYELASAGQVHLRVYDLLGREVAVLVDQRRAAGSYRDTFDGSGLASGVYIYCLTAGLRAQSRAMVLLK